MQAARAVGIAATRQWRDRPPDLQDEPGVSRGSNRRRQPWLAAMMLIHAADLRESAERLQAAHEREVAQDLNNGYADTIEGFYIAHGMLKEHAVRLRRNTSTRTLEAHRVGVFRTLTAQERGFRDRIRMHSHILARSYETCVACNFVFPPVASLPAIQLFLSRNSKISINASSFPSLGEQPGLFADGPLGQFMTAVWWQAGGGLEDMFTLLVDLLPAISTYACALSDDGELSEKPEHIQIVKFVDALSPACRAMLVANCKETVLFLREQRLHILQQM